MYLNNVSIDLSPIDVCNYDNVADLNWVLIRFTINMDIFEMRMKKPGNLSLILSSCKQRAISIS